MEDGKEKPGQERESKEKTRRDKTAKQAAEFISHNLSLDGGSKGFVPDQKHALWK